MLKQTLFNVSSTRIGNKDYFYKTTGKNVFHTDGFVNGVNSKATSGGFTVFKNGEFLIKEDCKSLTYAVFTNNEAELLGVCYAIDKAEEGDEIITDSMNTLAWLRRGRIKTRIDLNKILSVYNKMLHKKRLNIYWLPRNENLAGNWNEFKK